jgi:hypothetical protein
MDEDDVLERASAWLRGKLGRPGAGQLGAARHPRRALRERWGLPGMSVDTVRGFRDKQLMKERVRAAGLRVPRSRRVRTETRDARGRRGDRLPAHPQAHRRRRERRHVPGRRRASELDATLLKMRGVREASCEEYIDGEEFTFDTVCIGGVPAFENVAAYLPKPIEMRSIEWISPVIITVRDMAAAQARAGIALGRKRARRARDGGRVHPHGVVPHVEGRGRVRRDRLPPGRRVPRRPDELHVRHRPVPRVGARGVLGALRGRHDAQVQRRGHRVKRALGQGRITRIEGLESWLRRAGGWVVEEKLLRPGTPQAKLEADAPLGRPRASSGTRTGTRRTAWRSLAATGIKMFAE